MSFRAWYVSRGRITRRTWWVLYTLPIAGLAILAMIADASLGYPVFTMTPEDGLYSVAGGPVSTVISVATFVPSISSTVTRLHDRGYSAWWLLLSLVPVVGLLVLIAQCGLLAGQAGANRYGFAPENMSDLAGAP